ncbi:hypothetical protein J2S17_000728 [Cytobacillus purgationiresistens]|uniref:Regulatory protein YrvL n=1 Tax=Cytobacillus purgationiresistens TaxID=863449 RepID=A0ABU0AC82_9BACI|nr:hypothetical protein [Cytobacillus purgationiresistens]
MAITFIAVFYLLFNLQDIEYSLAWVIGIFIVMYCYALPVSLFSDFILKIYLLKRIVGLIIYTLFSISAIVMFYLIYNDYSDIISLLFLESAAVVLIIVIIYWTIDELLRFIYIKINLKINTIN